MKTDIGLFRRNNRLGGSSVKKKSKKGKGMYGTHGETGFRKTGDGEIFKTAKSKEDSEFEHPDGE